MLRHGPPAPEVAVGDATAPHKNLLNFSTYNYLGLSTHPDVLRGAKDAIDQYGLGAGASLWTLTLLPRDRTGNRGGKLSC